MNLEEFIAVWLVSAGMSALVPGSKSMLLTPHSVVALKVMSDYFWASVSSPAKWQILRPLQGGRLDPMKPQAWPSFSRALVNSGLQGSLPYMCLTHLCSASGPCCMRK